MVCTVSHLMSLYAHTHSPVRIQPHYTKQYTYERAPRPPGRYSPLLYSPLTKGYNSHAVGGY